MRKLLKRRPSTGTVIAFVALCVALGGGAYAATSKKVEYKGLSKDARLKVLPVSATNAGGSDSGGTDCDPNSSSTFTKCTSVSIQTSTGFPRKILLIFDGTFKAASGTAAGQCRLQVDNDTVNGTTTKIDASASDPKSYGINIVAKPTGGTHTYSVNCNETSGDLRVTQYELSAATVR